MASPIELLLLAQSVTPNVPVTTTLFWSTSTTLINSSTDIPVNSLAAPVTAGTTYSLSALVAYVTASSGGVPVFSLHGPATSGVILATNFFSSNAGTVTAARVLNGSLSPSSGPTMTASDTCAYQAAGLVTFSASGTLSLQAHTTIGSDTFTCQVMSFFSVVPQP